jgi:hypothetical protein
MKTKIRLTPKSVDGLHVIDQYGDIWDVHLIKDESFILRQTIGPWLLVSPTGCSESHTATRWVHRESDLKFEVHSI